MIKPLILSLALAVSVNVYADDEAHYQAALAVVKVPQGEQLEAMIQGLLENQINMNPSIRPVRNAFATFYRETFQSEAFLHGLAKIQMELFTHEELIEIKAMMDLPIFQRYEQVLPTFMTKNMQLGQEVVMANSARLKELLEAEHKRIEELQRLDQQMNLTGDN